jgi:hypothetical protein
MTGPETRIANPECECLCHEGNVVVHLVPCCAACPHCGGRITGANRDHRCRPLDSRGPNAFPWRGLLAMSYRVAPLLVALIVMTLAIWSVPYPALAETVAVGNYPPWLEDSDVVLSAVVPEENGAVVTGVY